MQFDVANKISQPHLTVRYHSNANAINWTWDDENSMQALISVQDDLGPAVFAWETESLTWSLKMIFNSTDCKSLTKLEELTFDWVRGYNMSFSGKYISKTHNSRRCWAIFENPRPKCHPGRWSNWEPIELAREQNPVFGDYNITFTSPLQSEPGGMIFYVEAVELKTVQNSPILVTTRSA